MAFRTPSRTRRRILLAETTAGALKRAQCTVDDSSSKPDHNGGCNPNAGDILSEPSQYAESPPLWDGTVSLDDTGMVVPGPIHLVDHGLIRVNRKGLPATIDVEVEVDPEISNPDSDDC